MTKPVYKHGWPSRRRAPKEPKRKDQGVQTEMSFGDTLALWQDRDRNGRAEVESEKGEAEDIGEEYSAPTSSGEEAEEIISCDADGGVSEESEDEDVRLSTGERVARLKQKGIPDHDGFYDCNPNDVELNTMEIRERRYRLKRGITADSGAGDPVIPRKMVNAKKIRPSAGSKRGLHYVSATDHRIPNVGEIDFEFRTEEGVDESIVFQVADVNKPLMSISDRVDHNCRCL